MGIAVNHLLCFGFGYSARALSARLAGWKISATSRSAEGVAKINAHGASGFLFDQNFKIAPDTTHVLISAPPDENGDPVLRVCGDQLRSRQFTWVGYLSTTGVYGDAQGKWVDEDSPLKPNTPRGEKRLHAERAWLQAQPAHLFRLAGIYGPGRNQLLSVMDGGAKRIIKAGQIFSRIHVDDIAGVLQASIAKPNPGRAYNACDDEPCPPQDVVAYAARLLNLPLPPEIPFDEAKLSPMARSFYADSKKVSNARVKTELGYKFLYPTYREGLAALLSTLTA